MSRIFLAHFFLYISIVIALYFHTLRMLLAYSTYFMIIIIRYFDQLYRCLRKRRNTILQRSSFKMDQIKKKKKKVTLFHQTDSSNRLWKRFNVCTLFVLRSLIISIERYVAVAYTTYSYALQISSVTPRICSDTWSFLGCIIRTSMTVRVPKVLVPNTCRESYFLRVTEKELTV